MNDGRFSGGPMGTDRRRAGNLSTVCMPARGGHGAAPPFEELFIEHYPTVREICEKARFAGVALLVMQGRQLVAAGTLIAKRGDINTAVLGRHGVADVFVEGDPALSLRHALLVLHPCSGDEELRYRVVDLRSGAGFVDEQGRELESVETEGPIFLRCSEQSVMLIPTEPDPVPWPDDPHDGWQCIPERVFLRETPPPPGRTASRGSRSAVEPSRVQSSGTSLGRAGRQSLIWFLGGPGFAQPALVGLGETAVAELLVHRGAEVSSMELSATALQRGILIGRYERCDGHGLPTLAYAGLSRVHLLVTEVRGAPYVIDLASTNGVYCCGQRIRSAPLVPLQPITLADGEVWLEWRA